MSKRKPEEKRVKKEKNKTGPKMKYNYLQGLFQIRIFIDTLEK